jgi:hypothetical protein
LLSGCGACVLLLLLLLLLLLQQQPQVLRGNAVS